jgi:CBS domain containing-hemolysin-like protein
MQSDLLLIIFALALVLLNGFFVAAEFGLVKLRSTRVKAIAKNYRWIGKILIKVHKNLDTYLSTCQLGITLTSLGLGWLGEPAFAMLIEPLLSLAGVESDELVKGISFAAAFFIISYLHIVIGELVPKSLAIRMSERLSIWTAPGLYFFYWLMFPAIWVLNQSANLILHMLNLKSSELSDSNYSSEELKMILRASRPREEFNAIEWKVLAQAIDFKELVISDLMRPFGEAVALYEADTFAQNLEKMTSHRYSRYPWIGLDSTIKGIIHVKDVFVAMAKDNSFNDLESLVRQVELVSPDTHASELFKRLKKGAPHFTVVGYDDWEPLGFVTLDNLLSALVGDIRDEFKRSQAEWITLEDGSLLGKGTVPINTLERTLGIDIVSEEADTVAGLVLWKLAELPAEGQRIPFEQFDVVIKKMAGPKVLLVRVYPNVASNNQD